METQAVKKASVLMAIEKALESSRSNDFNEIIQSIVSILSILEIFFQEDLSFGKELLSIKNKLHIEQSYKDFNRQKTKNYIEKYRHLLIQLKSNIELDLFSKNNKSSDQSIFINSEINLSQQLFVNVNSVVHILKETLSESQLNQLKSENTRDKTKLIEKIKGFGITTVSEIVSKLLANPEVYNKLFS